jgi:nitrile hydratase subunit beta
MRTNGVVPALGEDPIFQPGDQIRISECSPIGHYRMPSYLRGKSGSVEAVIEPTAVDNKEEAFGRDAGSKRHYDRRGRRCGRANRCRYRRNR